MASEWANSISSIIQKVNGLNNFHVEFWTETEFIGFINGMANHFSTYGNLWFLGYFDNSFAKKIELNYNSTSIIEKDVRVLSLPFRKDSRGRINKRTLEKLQRLKVNVKINDHLHGRLALLFNRGIDNIGIGHCEVVLGSFDFNKDSLSGDKTNTGIHTRNIDIVSSAKRLYKNAWESSDSISLEKYTENW